MMECNVRRLQLQHRAGYPSLAPDFQSLKHNAKNKSQAKTFCLALYTTFALDWVTDRF
jgi:hypothetical protein